ncbi:DeoR family transcriptional regulator [Centipeda periodontii DSM 2778]|uniref:DeoR family transcriptional regulator n=2 Tax=Centipeda TaxID=82202 RepID=F5RPL7_9FIRM|nr:DeoR family transcriptional regulator [Centipeda periodontii DSM 2778]
MRKYLKYRKEYVMKSSKAVIYRRQQNLLKLLQREKTIEVESAAQELGVSPTTIRRDLQEFSKQRLVTRFHGGAQLIAGTLQEEDPPENGDPKARIDRSQKEAIARRAAELIEDGDTIFMNSSSTTMLLLDYIKDKRVIIVTNNSHVIGYPHAPSVTIILTGGEIYERRQSLVGDFALQTLSKINANKTFLGVSGINAKSGITTSVLPETAINEMMMRHCQGNCYVLAARGKIGHTHNFRSGSIRHVHTLITCNGADADALAEIAATGIRVIEVEENI